MRLSMPGWMGRAPGGVDAGGLPAVSIPVLFAAQVARTPEAVAMSVWGPVDDLSRAG